MKAIFGSEFLWLAAALSVLQFGCAPSSNRTGVVTSTPAESTPAETNVQKVAPSSSTLNTAQAQRTLNLWVAQRIQGEPGKYQWGRTSTARIIGALTPWRGDQDHIVAHCRVHIVGGLPGGEDLDSIAEFVRGKDGNWYLTAVAQASGAPLDHDLNLKVE